MVYFREYSTDDYLKDSFGINVQLKIEQELSVVTVGVYCGHWTCVRHYFRLME